MGQSVEPQPRHKIRTLLTLFTSKKPGPRNVLPSGDLPMEKSLFSVFATAFRYSDPKRAGDGQALQYFVYLDFGSNISNAGDVLCRVSLELFLVRKSLEVFSPRSTRNIRRLARRLSSPFISNSSSIFGKFMRRLPPNSRTFSPRPEFFQIS